MEILLYSIIMFGIGILIIERITSNKKFEKYEKIYDKYYKNEERIILK